MQRASMQAQGGPIQPKHRKELCLSSMDSGSVWSLSALCILKEMMLKVDLENSPKKSEYSTLIGGTSTGGLILITVGRIEMSVGDPRQAHRGVFDEAFQRKKYQDAPAFQTHRIWDLEVCFDLAALELGMNMLS